ncbi:hypothetical protein GCM10010271_03100 [Streptomyces kurssanovii]|nr:hypothetical protein GCM10010271_03100 [Streptomyces kurssanovii]
MVDAHRTVSHDVPFSEVLEQFMTADWVAPGSPAPRLPGPIGLPVARLTPAAAGCRPASPVT